MNDSLQVMNAGYLVGLEFHIIIVQDKRWLSKSQLESLLNLSFEQIVFLLYHQLCLYWDCLAEATKCCIVHFTSIEKRCKFIAPPSELFVCTNLRVKTCLEITSELSLLYFRPRQDNLQVVFV